MIRSAPPCPPAGWEAIGGTSLVAPAWAGITAVANQGRVKATKDHGTVANEAQKSLYGLAAGDFHDIISGSITANGHIFAGPEPVAMKSMAVVRPSSMF